MVYTWWELNVLNGEYWISAPQNSVAIIKLIRNHKPKSNEELVRLIKSHYETTCECWIKSQWTIKTFWKNLYDAQIKKWWQHKYSLEECIQWEYDLFVIQSLKWNKIEDKIKILLNTKLKALDDKFLVVDANNYLDEELRIDLVVKFWTNELCWIQVKPSSYKHIRENVKYMNAHRNALSNMPVTYIYYDYNEESVEDIESTIDFIKGLI